MSADRTKLDTAPSGRTSAAVRRELVSVWAIAAAAMASSDVETSAIATNGSGQQQYVTPKSQRPRHAEQRRGTAAPTSPKQAEPVFSMPWTYRDDLDSLGPLDHESTAIAGLVPGALMDYTGTTIRVDMTGQVLPYVQSTFFLVPRQ